MCLFFFGFAYCVWLFIQLIVANVDVVQAYLRPQMAIDPKVIRFKLPMDNPVATTFLANSITLTPGTVTINVTKDNVFEIHALTKGAAEAHRKRRYAKTCGAAL